MCVELQECKWVELQKCKCVWSYKSVSGRSCGWSYKSVSGRSYKDISGRSCGWTGATRCSGGGALSVWTGVVGVVSRPHARNYIMLAHYC